MPTVSDILARKGSHVHCIEADATVLQATQKMNEHQIGALVVTQGERIVGIFTERDVLRRVVAEQREPAETTVGEVMTREVMCCPADADLDDIGATMRDRRIRHLPVCDGDGQLLGMVSIGDLNAFHAKTQESTIYFLSEYIYGRA